MTGEPYDEYLAGYGQNIGWTDGNLQHDVSRDSIGFAIRGLSDDNNASIIADGDIIIRLSDCRRISVMDLLRRIEELEYKVTELELGRDFDV